MNNIRLVYMVLVKAVIITALINFYMFSIMPDGSESYSSPANLNKKNISLMESTAIDEYDTAQHSWVCVRRVPANVEKNAATHGRRLNGSGNANRVHRGFHKDHPEPVIHYGEKQYESKAHIIKAHLERSNTFEQQEKEDVREVSDHSAGAIRRIYKTIDQRDAKKSSSTSSKYGRCEMYSCTNKNGVFVETNSSDTNQGYAGKFVHKENDIAPQIMRTPGGNKWASGCVVSPKYKFIYIHVLKSGGTATKEFIRKSLCGEEDPECKRISRQVVHPYSCKHAMLEHPDYFTFTFVRNPFSRMYSMYSMMDGFPINPNDRGHVTDSLSFQNFVKMAPIERKKYSKIHPSHYKQQTDFIFSKSYCPVFDFLGRVEHFDEDMRTILEHLNAKEMIDYLLKSGGVEPANTWGSNKKKSLKGNLGSEYGVNETNKVATYYKTDFDLLGYDSSMVPNE